MARISKSGGALLLALAVVAGTVVVTGQPKRWLTCGWESREGWTVEFPTERLSEAEFRRTIRDQSQCFEIVTVLVDTDAVPEGDVVEPIGTREWIGSGGVLRVRIEGESDDGAIGCNQPLSTIGDGDATELLTCPDDSVVEPPAFDALSD